MVKAALISLLFAIASAFGGDLPDRNLTPGATVDVPLQKLCQKGYAGSVRNVSGAEKAKVYAEYSIEAHAPGAYEVDHLISLELGGSNEIANLWPQSYSGTWNAHVKDALEDRLHELVCEPNPPLTLAHAQHAIRTDWIAEYKRIFKTQAPLN